MKIATALLALTIASVAFTPALADCVDGNRERTAQEQAFADKLTASLKAALPAAPAPLNLEREPQVIVQTACKDTPPGKVSALVVAVYAASLHYSDRVKVTLRANHAYPDATDLVLGTLPKKPEPFKVQNLVVKVDGHKQQHIEAIKQVIDRDRLQQLIDQPLPDKPPPVAWTVGTPAATTAKAAAPTSSTASGAAPPSQPAAANRPESAPAVPDPTQAVADKAKDAVNTLRSLFGR